MISKMTCPKVDALLRVINIYCKYSRSEFYVEEMLYNIYYAQLPIGKISTVKA